MKLLLIELLKKIKVIFKNGGYKMTGSWTIDVFIILSILVFVIPLGIYIYREFFKGRKESDKE